MSLRRKKILITAGPTWVPLDSVRVMSNTASGETGILLAEQLTALGARVTLLMGPVLSGRTIPKRVRKISFCFFNELKERLTKELKSRRYDAVIHAAAVSDFAPAQPLKGKYTSDKRLTITLIPTTKIIDSIKKINPRLHVIGFKFEPEAKHSFLIAEARALMKRARLDLVVANTTLHRAYQAYLVSAEALIGPFRDKKALVNNLCNVLGKIL
ncbi:MAG: phosphopantothenoylcysteine decarboxylase [Candidatus Omnitrophica bacterium]|nr:phosphopantothenoylcysteine decarboxylase [Candidatus Omnitrophota bacterium]